MTILFYILIWQVISFIGNLCFIPFNRMFMDTADEYVGDEYVNPLEFEWKEYNYPLALLLLGLMAGPLYFLLSLMFVIMFILRIFRHFKNQLSFYLFIFRFKNSKKFEDKKFLVKQYSEND